MSNSSKDGASVAVNARAEAGGIHAIVVDSIEGARAYKEIHGR